MNKRCKNYLIYQLINIIIRELFVAKVKALERELLSGLFIRYGTGLQYVFS